jgi:hypothetical protein
VRVTTQRAASLALVVVAVAEAAGVALPRLTVLAL